MAEAVLCEGLTKHFGQLEAVRGLDLSIHSGEVFGLVGPDGAGKSTTIRMLNTILLPTSGAATVLGHDVVREETPSVATSATCRSSSTCTATSR